MKTFSLLATFLAAAALATGCTEPRRTIYQVDIGVEVAEQANIRSVIIYIYDSNNSLVGYQVGGLSTWFNLNAYRSSGSVNLVAWGNALGDALSLNSTEQTPDRAKNRVVVEDSTATFAGHQLSRTVPDLFFGAINSAINGEYEDPSIGNNRYILGKIKLNRVVASYQIVVKGLVGGLGGVAPEYKVVVVHPYSALNFSAEVAGGISYTVPHSTYNETLDELTTSAVYALPTAELGVVVELYRQQSLVYSTATQSNSPRLGLVADKFHSIVIDLSDSSIEADIEIIPAEWDDEKLEQEF